MSNLKAKVDFIFSIKEKTKNFIFCRSVNKSEEIRSHEDNFNNDTLYFFFKSLVFSRMLRLPKKDFSLR